MSGDSCVLRSISKNDSFTAMVGKLLTIECG